MSLVLTAVLLLFSWSLAWGYDIVYVLCGVLYAVALVIGGGMLGLAITNSRCEGGLCRVMARATVLGLVISLMDYFTGMFLFAKHFSVFYVLYCSVIILILVFTKQRRRTFVDWWSWIWRSYNDVINQLSFSSWMIVAVWFLYFAALAVFRINPENWPGNHTYYNVDMSWHIAMSTQLTEDFPVRIPSFYQAFYYVYHCLAHVLSAHLSQIFGLHPSLAYLQSLPVLLSIFLVQGLVAFFVRWGLSLTGAGLAISGLLFFGATDVNTVTRQLYIAESMPLSVAFMALGLSQLGPNGGLRGRSFVDAALIGLAIGFSTISKGSLGPVIALAIAIVGGRDILFSRSSHRERITIAAKYAVCGTMTLVLYKIFFANSIHSGGIKPIGETFFQWIHQGKFQLLLLFFCVVSFAFMYRNFKSLRGLLALLGLIALISKMFYEFAEVYGNQHYFLLNIGVVAYLAIALIMGHWAYSWRAKYRYSAIFLGVLAILSTTVPLRWILHPYDQESRLMAVEKDVKFDKDLFNVARFLRDSTPKDSFVVHRVGTDLKRIEARANGGSLYLNLQVLTAFSERVSYVGYLPEFIAHAWGFIVRTKEGRDQLYQARQDLEEVFNGQPSEQVLSRFKSLKKPIYFVWEGDEYEHAAPTREFMKLKDQLKAGNYVVSVLEAPTNPDQ